MQANLASHDFLRVVAFKANGSAVTHDAYNRRPVVVVVVGVARISETPFADRTECTFCTHLRAAHIYLYIYLVYLKTYVRIAHLESTCVCVNDVPRTQIQRE